MTEKQKNQPDRDENTQDVAPDEVRTDPNRNREPRHSQVPDVNPPSVQPGHRDREQV